MRDSAPWLLLILLAVGGCTTTQSDPATPDHPSSPATSELGKYEQTWAKDYGKTTCREWLRRMDEHERFVAAADMLLGAQQVGNRNADLPSGKLVGEFSGALDKVCSVAGRQHLAEIAAAEYLVDHQIFAP